MLPAGADCAAPTLSRLSRGLSIDMSDIPDNSELYSDEEFPSGSQ